MLQIERHEKILELVAENGSVRTSELYKIFNTTRQTIRNDIEYLDEQGKLVKVHGGAISSQAAEEPKAAERKIHKKGAKEAIAKAAADLVKAGDTIFLDMGTTVNKMVPYLNQMTNLTIITNSVETAYQLASNENNQVIITGGVIRGDEMSVSGPHTDDMLRKFYVDKSFLGAGGISAAAGFTDYHVLEANTRTLVIAHAKTNYVLADDSKIRVTAIHKFADLGDIDCLITNIIPSKTLLNRLNELEIEYIQTEID